MIHRLRLITVVVGVVLLTVDAALAAPVQYAKIRTGHGDPQRVNDEQTHATYIELEGVATEASNEVIYPYPDRMRTNAISAGSSVVMARASAGGVLGASAYTGWYIGTDNYSGTAIARTEEEVILNLGPTFANQTVTIAVGAIVNGGLGVYGSDAAAQARAYFTFQGVTNIQGDTAIFQDSAYGESGGFNPDNTLKPPVHVYNYSPREDYRYVDVLLDGNGDGSFIVKLTLDVDAYEEGDENIYNSAAAADYGDTIYAHLQPWSGDFQIGTTAGWEVRPHGTQLSVSPNPVTLTPEQLGVPEPSSLMLLALGGVLVARRA